MLPFFFGFNAVESLLHLFRLLQRACPDGELEFVGGMFYPLHPQGEGGVVEPTETKRVALLGGVVERNLRSTEGLSQDAQFFLAGGPDGGGGSGAHECGGGGVHPPVDVFPLVPNPH